MAHWPVRHTDIQRDAPARGRGRERSETLMLGSRTYSTLHGRLDTERSTRIAKARSTSSLIGGCYVGK